MGLLSAAALMLVARPLSVLVFQPFSPFSWKEALLISWCGLRGAVPLALSYNVVTVIPRIRGIDRAGAEDLAQNAKSIILWWSCSTCWCRASPCPGWLGP